MREFTSLTEVEAWCGVASYDESVEVICLGVNIVYGSLEQLGQSN